MPESRQAEVFLHEMVHIVADMVPEFMVRDVGKGLYGILVENDLLRPNFLSSVITGTATVEEVRRIEAHNERILEEQEAQFFRVTDRPWDGSESRFTPEQWQRSCLIHTAFEPDTYLLPICEPDGALSRNGAHSAAALLVGSGGGVQAPAGERRAAARRLLVIYRDDLKEEPPASLRRVAGF
jgi:hypothetical protein